MASKKITELTEVTSPIATDVFPIVNGGETKKVQLTNTKSILGIDDIDTRLTTAEGEIDNLDNVTKYITATAGSNGDFKVNIPNTLETNMKISILFPTATTGTSDARLSLDGGTTYKTITWAISTNTIILANYIEGKRVDLFYDGTYWKVLDLDSGWIDIGSYLNTTYFTVRPGYTPYVKRIKNQLFFKGEVYCTTAVGSKQVTLFNAIPSTFRPILQQSNSGVQYLSTELPYNIFLAPNGVITISKGENIVTHLETFGYQLTNLNGSILD